MGGRISDDDLRRMVKAATPGPWSTMGSCVVASGSCDTYSGNVLGTIAYASSLHETDGEGRNWWTGGEPEANARLIALAPALAAEVLQLREALTDLLDACERMGVSGGNIAEARALTGGQSNG